MVCLPAMHTAHLTTERQRALLNTIARGGDGRFCCVWWSVWMERVVAVAGPLVDLAASVSFCLTGIPRAFQLKGRGHRQLVADVELTNVQVILGDPPPLLSTTVRTHRRDVELGDPPWFGCYRHPVSYNGQTQPRPPASPNQQDERVRR